MYKLLKNPQGQTNFVLRLSDSANIPMNEQNSDYVAYLKWLEEGNEPLPAENT